MITYSTNWMGPVSARFYEQHGPGWAGGRIDIYGVPGEPYGLEYGLPIMRAEDWNNFSEWLEGLETPDVMPFDAIIHLYESANPTIRWFEGE